jgi:dTDP-4-amino-4,6-dideoxygalactose transaminase
MNDFRKDPPELIRAQQVAVERVINSGWYILGPQVENFESRWSQYLSAAHAIGVANGMDAIEIGLRALDLPGGSEVITTSMTAFATVLAILRAGLVPVIADIDPDTGIMDPDSVLRCMTSRTKAILLVHLYGRATDMDHWQKIAASKDLFLIEDCAQAHGARWGGKPLGSFGAFGAWSFYPTKNLGALGDGGAITTDNADLSNKVKVLRNYGQSVRYYHPVIGLNSRLDELQAAILNERLRWLDQFTNRRKAIAQRYHEEIKNPLVRLLQKPADPSHHVYHLFVVKTQIRSQLEKHLAEKGVQTHIHYPVPIHHQESVRGIKTDPKGLSSVENYAKECISLPIHPMLTDDEVSQVVSAINSFE